MEKISKRSKITPEIIQRVKEIKRDRPDLSYRKIAKLLLFARRSVNISKTTVGRILRDEYWVKDGKAIWIKMSSLGHCDSCDKQVSKPKKIPALPGQITMIKQFRKAAEVVIHEAAEMSRENKVRDAMTVLKNDLLDTDMEFEYLVRKSKNDELDAIEEKLRDMGFDNIADEIRI